MITIRPDAASLKRVQQSIALYGKQGRYALARTLNDTAVAIQADGQAAIPKHVTVRTAASERWLAQRVMIPRGGWATRERLRVEIGVMDGDSSRQRGKSSLLATLAGGGGRKVEGKWGPLAVPTKALRPNPRATIAMGAYPRALRVLERRDVDGGTLPATVSARRTRGAARVRKGMTLGPTRTKAGKWIIRGKVRTFAIDPRFQRAPANAYGVYQRTGPKRSDVRKIWKYMPSYPVPSRIPFPGIADRTTRRVFGPAFINNQRLALATARR